LLAWIPTHVAQLFVLVARQDFVHHAGKFVGDRDLRLVF
jgi:hypothetical protein